MVLDQEADGVDGREELKSKLGRPEECSHVGLKERPASAVDPFRSSVSQLLGALRTPADVTLLADVARLPFQVGRSAVHTPPRPQSLARFALAGWFRRVDGMLHLSAVSAESVARYFDDLVERAGPSKDASLDHPSLSTSHQADSVPEALALMSSEPRRRLVELIVNRRTSVSALSRSTGMGHTLVSFHLSKLRAAAIVTGNRGSLIGLNADKLGELSEFIHGLHLGGVVRARCCVAPLTHLATADPAGGASSSVAGFTACRQLTRPKHIDDFASGTVECR